MKVLILAGGFATRLRPLSCTRPKILFPIVNKPLLEWTLEGLAKSGVNEAILATNRQTEDAIKHSRLNRHGIRIAYSRDPPKTPLGTGGPIKKAEQTIGHSTSFLVINGDIFASIDYQEILKLHKKKDTVATIALHKVEDPSRFGVAELAEDHRIKRFIEKPPRKNAPSNLINAGIYVLSPKIFEYILKGQSISLEREVFPKLAEEGTLYGYIFNGIWTDIGKPEDFLEINRVLLDSLSNKQQYTMENNVKIEKPVAFDKGVPIGEKSVIGPHVVLGKDVFVGKNVRIRNSIVFPNTVLSDSSFIDGAVIGESVFIGTGAKVGKGCVIGDYVRIRDNVSLAKDVLICPAKEVSKNVYSPRCVV